MTTFYALGYGTNAACSASNTRNHGHDSGKVCRSNRHKFRYARQRIGLLSIFVLLFGFIIGILVNNIAVAASPAGVKAEIHHLGSMGGSLLQDQAPGLVVRSHETTDSSSDGMSQIGASHQSVDVERGDSLWSIARKHKPVHMNIRHYIDLMMILNGLEDSTLHEGMLLYLP